MQVGEINLAQTKSITPVELLERFKQGERPEFQNKDDVLKEELDTLAEQYNNQCLLIKK